MKFVVFTSLLHLACGYTPPAQIPLSDPQNEYGPSIASARANANSIFNAIHSSMRQWGSSIQHNGMSFFPAYIPTGTLLYHGTPETVPPIGPEWMAFEIPHAEMFAVGWKPIPPPHDDRRGHDVQVTDDGFVDLRTMSPKQISSLDEPDFEFIPGYLHIYQTDRPMKVLYLDGMSAGNSERGTLDSQDLLLLNFTGGIWDERRRAAELCRLGEELGVDGFIRMECGFELIKCDFSKGLRFLSHKQRPNPTKPEGLNPMFTFEFVRDIGSRYHGIDAGRVVLDYSSMVSAFFYPANLSNPSPDSRQAKLPRLVAADVNVLKRIKSDLRGSTAGSVEGGRNNWQGITDMIVKRYASRLQLLATGLPYEKLLSEVNMIMNTFIDYSISGEQDPVYACSQHYLRPWPVQTPTEQDFLIAAAFQKVTERICSTLNHIRDMLLHTHEKPDERTNGVYKKSMDVAVQMVTDLNTWLDWSDWITCGQCAIDEVCFVAIFPMGTPEDHYFPRCRNSTYLGPEQQFINDNYWIPDLKLP